MGRKKRSEGRRGSVGHRGPCCSDPRGLVTCQARAARATPRFRRTATRAQCPATLARAPGAHGPLSETENSWQWNSRALTCPKCWAIQKTAGFGGLQITPYVHPPTTEPAGARGHRRRQWAGAWNLRTHTPTLLVRFQRSAARMPKREAQWEERAPRPRPAHPWAPGGRTPPLPTLLPLLPWNDPELTARSAELRCREGLRRAAPGPESAQEISAMAGKELFLFR